MPDGVNLRDESRSIFPLCFFRRGDHQRAAVDYVGKIQFAQHQPQRAAERNPLDRATDRRVTTKADVVQRPLIEIDVNLGEIAQKGCGIFQRNFPQIRPPRVCPAPRGCLLPMRDDA